MPKICEQCGKEHETLEELEAKEKPKKIKIKKISKSLLDEPDEMT